MNRTNKMQSPLMASSVAFIGIGQAGGNIAKKFMDLGYSAFFINTSATDLSTIEADKHYKFQIPLAQGCSKDRNLAKKYAKEYFGTINNLINSRLANFTHVMLCFSMGGGTGSGMTPLLADFLATEVPDIKFCMIAAIPEMHESAKSKHNAVSCFKEISSLTSLGNIYFINNNHRNNIKGGATFKQFDERFANKMHDFLSITIPDEKGNADESEVKTLLSMDGNVVFADLFGAKLPTGEDIPMVDIEPTMAITNKGCAYLAYSLTSEDDFVSREVENVFGRPSDYFKGYNSKQSFVVAFGLPLPEEAIQSLIEGYKEDLDVIDSVKDEFITLDIPDFIDPNDRRRKNRKMAGKLGNLLDDFNL